MKGDYQRHVERRLRDGRLARVDRSRGETGYLYHRDGRYWLLVVDDGLEKQYERPATARLRRRIIDEHDVEVVEQDDVPGPVAALSRARSDDG